MARLTRIAGSFALVLVAYWAYGVAALPWIEPPAVPEQRSGGAQGQDLDAWRRDSEDDRLKALARPFQPQRMGTATDDDQHSRKRPGKTALSRVQPHRGRPITACPVHDRFHAHRRPRR